MHRVIMQASRHSLTNDWSPTNVIPGWWLSRDQIDTPSTEWRDLRWKLPGINDRVLLSGLTIPRRGMLDRCFREFCKNFRSIRRSSLRTKPNISATVICFPLNIILKSIKSKRPWNFLTSTWNRRYLTEYVTLDGYPHKGMKIYSRTRRFRYSAYAMYNFNEEIISCLFMEIFFIYF